MRFLTFALVLLGTSIALVNAQTFPPSFPPTFPPTLAPTAAPTAAPTGAPTPAPTPAPTFGFTTAPPTFPPTTAPPTEAPTEAPTTAPPTEAEEKYFWKVGPWKSCSKTCNSGSQTRTVQCIQHGAGGGAAVADSFCSDADPDNDKPDSSRVCNTRQCPNPLRARRSRYSK